MILLEDRGVIQITGTDATSFLQGLITNDINQASEDNLLYTAMLTPQGKFLFDFFILKTADGYLLDCYKPTIAALIKKLSIYKLRSDITIKNVSDVYAVYSDSARGLPDPRMPEFGRRLITGDKPETNAGFAAYEKRRIEAGLPESADFITEDDFPLQCNLEQLNGVNFNKGCYVGQEVTARTKYKGAIKYSFYKVSADTPLAKDGKILRSVHGNIGIAHLPVTNDHNAEINGQTYKIAPILK
jgi:tRNA-modifying protein YgfZ